MTIKQLFARTVAGVLVTAMALVGRAQPTAPVSGATNISASGSGGSYLPMFSEDYSHIAFVSHANNLVTNDDSGLTLDVFRANIFSGATDLVSVNTDRSGGANADCSHISISRYGWYVAFASRAYNLTTNDTNNAVDVFFRSYSPVAAPFTRLVSANPSGYSPAEPTPFAPRALSTSPQVALFQDRIAFASAATNLVSGLQDTNGAYDVFVRDGLGVSTATRLVSVANVAEMTPDGLSHSPQIGGQFVAFISTATNLSLFVPPGVTNSNRGGDIYIRDLMNSRTYWASPHVRTQLVGAFPAPPSSYTCFNYALSGFGQAVVFQANADPHASYSSNVLLYFQIGSSNTIRIATDSDLVGRPQIIRSGDLVAFSSRSNVYLWSRATGSNTLVSVNTNGLPGNGPSHSPVMDPNGNYIAFVSRASDLIPGGGPSNRFQIYVYNRALGTNRLLSVNTNDIASVGDFESSNISIAPDNPSLIAFDSTAPDLVTNDFNGASDIFVSDPKRTWLISRAHTARPARTAPPMSGTTPNSVSADGRVVAFTAFDNPFVSDDTNIWQDVFVRDLASGDLRRVSGQPVFPYWTAQAAIDPIVSRAGNHVVYSVSRAGTGGPDRFLFSFDRLAATNVFVHRDSPSSGLGNASWNTSVSSNGDLIVFQSTTAVSTLASPICRMATAVATISSSGI